MIIDISKEEITNELLEEGLKWVYKNLTDKTIKKSPKWLILNWDNLSTEKFLDILPSIEKEYITDYLFNNTIRNKEILFHMFKHIETEGEEYLWNALVDCRHISNEVYLKNSYQENFDIWYKINSENFINLPKGLENHSYKYFIEEKNAPKISTEESRKLRVWDWLDKSINLDFFKETFDGVENLKHFSFKFKEGINIERPTIPYEYVKKMTPEQKEKITIDLSNEIAFSINVWNKTIETPINTSEFDNLIQRSGLPRHNDSYIKKWIKDRVGEINFM